MSQPVKFSKVVAVPGTGVPLFAAVTRARRWWVRAAKVGGANAGAVCLGDVDVDISTSRQMTLSAGDYWEPPIPDYQDRDLSQVYLDADNAADGVVGEYWPA